MMYNQKLVASIKANRKILREFKDTVYIPFASEYSILIKNLNTVRAVVNVYIDGEDQVPGGLVVDAGREIDLERSLKNNNLKEGNKFKFIERSGAVEKHRGVGLEDGIVRIEYQFELPPVRVNSLPDYNNILRGVNNGWIQASGASGGGSGYGGPMGATYSSTSASINNGWIQASGASGGGSGYGGPMGATYSSTSASINNVTVSATSASVTPQAMYNDAGITVAGSKSTQSFSTTYMGALDPVKHTIVLKLLGETPDNKPVIKPVTVKAKPKCTTCGKQNKAHAKFCAECGTALEIFA